MQILNNIKKNTIFLLIITAIVLYVVLKDDFAGIMSVLGTVEVRFVFLAILFFLLSITFKACANYLIVNDNKKITLKEAIKHNCIAQFFNGITPFSSGGQPMEVYMLTEHDIEVSKATTYTVQSFIFYQIALVLCGILAVLYNFIFHIFPKVKFLQHLVLLGFIINVIVVVVLLTVSFSKKINKKLSRFIVNICKFFKIKVKEQTIEKKFEEYHKGFLELRKKKKLIIQGITLNVLSLLFLYIIPIFMIFSLNDFTSINVADTLTSSAYVYLIGAFVPIPGASGGIEYGFTQFFGNFIANQELAVALIIWRTITYYFGIIMGALLFSLEKKVK